MSLEKKEIEKEIELENKKLKLLGTKLTNQPEKRRILEKALRSWEQLPDFLRKKIKFKNNYIKDYLEKEYIAIAKRYKEEEELKKKWSSLKT